MNQQATRLPDVRLNGSSSETPQPALPDDRAKAVEYGLVTFQQVSAERDQLREELRTRDDVIARLNVEIDSLHQLYNFFDSRMVACQADRDKAVAERAVYETLFRSINAQMHEFAIAPPTPRLEDTTDDGATVNHPDLVDDRDLSHRMSDLRADLQRILRHPLQGAEAVRQ
jgi:hypothetical protein